MFNLHPVSRGWYIFHKSKNCKVKYFVSLWRNLTTTKISLIYLTPGDLITQTTILGKIYEAMSRN